MRPNNWLASARPMKSSRPWQLPRPVRWLVGFFKSRAAVARELVEARRIAEEAGAKIEAAETAKRNAELSLSSARATITDRETEIGHLKSEKAATEAELELRKLEVVLLNQWLERVRCQLDADIAQEVARANKAVGSHSRGDGSANSPPT